MGNKTAHGETRKIGGRQRVRRRHTGLHPVKPGPAPNNGSAKHRGAPSFAAIDLGTNNCRLLIAQPSGHGFHVILRPRRRGWVDRQRPGGRRLAR